MAQETVLTQQQADAILAAMPANAEEARQIAQAIAEGWDLRISLGGQDEETPDAA